MNNLKLFLTFVSLFFSLATVSAQHFLGTSGKAIVNENQDTILLRGMGLGGWMVQEGYMLQTAGFASPQHKIRAVIEDLIGEEDTDAFYEAWLANHVRRADIDSLKSWGFNSVRLPLHYNLFTLPIEEEPIQGEDTWISKGFELTDSLISWCKANEMYVVLDMHASPGGQGYDEAISDYDPTKPSLWQSNENQRKLVALWARIAERYADEQWVAGYDLLNEPNWDLPGGTALRNLYGELTDAIRAVDNRHILFIEGNWFANDFTGLTPPWDDNFVYAPHKYWSYNETADIQWVLDLRERYDVPLYFGESGENSNVWFKDAISLIEGEGIGWAWWPMKKVESISGPLSINKKDGYQQLLDYWSGNGTRPSAAVAKAALMELTEELKAENCVYQKDVVDAMFRQIQSDETLPFKQHLIPGVIQATDYDLGPNGFAYYDLVSATYQVSTGEFTTWNEGWAYRNDGVDIEFSENTINSNGYNIGFMDAGEWMQYEVQVESGVYEAHVRTASSGSGGLFRFSMDGADITPRSFAGPTGGWQEWKTSIVPNIIINANDNKLRFHTEVAGFNLASFEFIKTGLTSADLLTEFISAETVDESTVKVSLNKSIDPSLPSLSSLELLVDGIAVPLSNVSVDSENDRLLVIEVDYVMNFTEIVQITYQGGGLLASDGTQVMEFILKDVKNSLEFAFEIPGLVEAEGFVDQSGVELESTTDIGAGQNVGFLDVGDYMDYNVVIKTGGVYEVSYRTAAQFGTGGLRLQLIEQDGAVTTMDEITFSSTGGWQNWETTNSTVSLPQGIYTMRAVITQAPFNLNWMSFDLSTSVNDLNTSLTGLNIFPNPSSRTVTVKAKLAEAQEIVLKLADMSGLVVLNKRLPVSELLDHALSIEDLTEGIYILEVVLKDGSRIVERVVKI